MVLSRFLKIRPDNIEVDTSQLQVRIPALASLNKYDDLIILVTSRSSRRTISTITMVAMSTSAGTLIKFPLSTRLLKRNDHGMVLIQSRTSVVTVVTTFPNLLMTELNSIYK